MVWSNVNPAAGFHLLGMRRSWLASRISQTRERGTVRRESNESTNHCDSGRGASELDCTTGDLGEKLARLFVAMPPC